MAKRKFLYFFPLYFLIVIIVFSSLNLKTKPPEILTELNKDISEFPITDLQVCPENLPEDESIVPLTIRNFSGYNYGCMSDKGNITKGECDYAKEPIGFPINAYYPNGKNLSVWHVNLCVKNYNKITNMTAYEYLMKHSVTEFKDCGIGMKKCGKIDDMDNYLCVNKEDSCPITDIIITNSNETLQDYDSINLTDNKRLLFTTLPTKGKIIKSLKVTEGKPCLNSIYTESVYPQFPLDNSFEYYICPSIHYKGDYLYYNKDNVILDSMNKSSFYAMNGLDNMRFRFSRKVDFPYNSLDETVNLYTSYYYGYKSSCISDASKYFAKFSDENYNTIKDRFDTIKKTSLGIVIVSGIALLLSLFPSCYITCTSDTYEEKDFGVPVAVGIPIFFVGIIIPSGMAFHQAINLYTINECGGGVSEMFISLFNDTINKTLIYCIIIFASSFVFLACCIIYLMSSCCLNSLKKCCGDDGNDCCGGDCCDDCCEDC